MFTYINDHISIHVFIPICPYTPYTYVIILRPYAVTYILLCPYTPCTCIYISTPIYALYVSTYFYAYISILVNISRLSYINTCLYTSTSYSHIAIFLYRFMYFYANGPYMYICRIWEKNR